MKIGIFAGTFDPVHSGHVAFAQSAIDRAGLDKVVMVAEKLPYRKHPHTSWDHRQAMIERATEGLEQVDHDYQFAAELAHQHTMQDMLLKAKQHFGGEHEFWFLAGSDLFEHLHLWRSVLNDHQYGGFVVTLRDDHTKEWLDQKVAQLSQQGFICHYQLVDNANPHISSSKIREAIIRHQSLNDLPAAVLAYIQSHGLYSST